MKKALIIGGMLAVGAGVLIATSGSASAAQPTNSRGTTYPLHPQGKWGPIWQSTRPPGLPADTRGCSAPGAALQFLRQAAADQLRDPAFVQTVLQLAQGESGQMFGRPANNYDNRPEHLRPAGKGRISAWGCFNWNEGHGQNSDHLAHLGIPGPGYPKDWRPTDDTPWREVNGPITFYGQIWRFVIVNRGSQLDAARAVRAHHKKSGSGRRLLELGRDSRRWADAFAQTFSADDRETINRHLRTAGVLTA